MREREHDTAVAATLAEHGLGRHALIDPDDHHPVSDLRTVTTPTGSGSSADARRTSSPSMTLGGINPGPVSAGGFGRQGHNPPYFADSFGQAYNPYADFTNNQVPHQHSDPGPSNPSGMHNFSLPLVSGVGLPFFSHGTKDSMGSSEPLLSAVFDNDPAPEPTIPAVPPRNPLRLMGGARDAYGGHGGEGSSNGENTGYRDDDDDVDYGGFRQGSLKVRNNPD